MYRIEVVCHATGWIVVQFILQFIQVVVAIQYLISLQRVVGIYWFLPDITISVDTMLLCPVILQPVTGIAHPFVIEMTVVVGKPYRDMITECRQDNPGTTATVRTVPSMRCRRRRFHHNRSGSPSFCHLWRRSAVYRNTPDIGMSVLSHGLL